MKKPKPIEPRNYNGLIVNDAYVSLQNKLLPLDFFCVKGTGFISWTIRYITKNLSPDRECEYNHAGLLPDGSACTLEALWHVETKNLFEHYEDCKILIGRYNNLTPEKYLKAIKAIQKHIDQPYPKRRLFFHLLNIAHHIHWINAVVCSELVAKVLYKVGARHHNYYGTTPDTLADEIDNQLNDTKDGPKYKIVFHGRLPWLIYKYCTKCRQVFFAPIVDKRCHRCKQVFRDESPIPHREIRKKVEEYNNLKIKYISKLQ